MHERGKCRIYGQPESTSWFNFTISVLCIITMRKLMLVYVPYHVSGFLRKKKKREKKKKCIYSLPFLFLTDLDVMTGSFLISRKVTAAG